MKTKAAEVIAAMSDEVQDGGAGQDEAGSILGVGMGQGDNLDNRSVLGQNGDAHGYDEASFAENEEVDKVLLKTALWQFRELGLTQEQAQGVAKMSVDLSKSLEDKQQRAWDKLTMGWAREIKNDPEVGGVRFRETISRVERVLQRFDTENELTDFLVTTKAGNHPALIRMLVRIDGMLGEDGFERGGNMQQKKRLTDAEIFFPEKR